MVRYCFVVGCNKHSVVHPGTKFYRIPKGISEENQKFGTKTRVRPSDLSTSELIILSKRRMEMWISVLRRGPLSETQIRNARICEEHFIGGCPADLTDKDHPDWVPCQKLGYEKGAAVKRKNSLTRHNRLAKRRNDSITDIFEEEYENFQPELEAIPEVETGTACQTDLTTAQINDLCTQLEAAKLTIEKLQQRVDKFVLSEESFQNNDAKTKYFTGLSKSKILMRLHVNVSQYLFTRGNTVLTTFQQLLLTLMKLRFDFPFKFLSYRFGVAEFTASRYFRRCLHVLYCSLKHFVHWPSRQVLISAMPECFKQSFGKQVSVIIDCFEVFIERPSDLHTSALCWSNYKHHKTVKVLLGMTPQGTVAFISEAWGGRVSDKYLTENSGFLEKLLPGDVVLADRGFLIEDSVNMAGAFLNIPAFTRGKTQLHPRDLEQTRNIAQVRIHVERIIGSTRQKYQILSGTVPISLLCGRQNGVSVFNQILFVCSALVNMCPSVMPMA